MNNSASTYMLKLNEILHSLPADCHSADFIHSPESSFVRSSKLNLVEITRFVLGAGPSTLRNELRFFFRASSISATPSAIVQARSKIKPELFQHILYKLNDSYKCTRSFKGFQLFAVDGSKLSIPYNSSDTSSFHKGKTKSDGSFGKGYNQLHATVVFDILNQRYIDAIINDITLYDEVKEMRKLIQKNRCDNAIYIADRGFESSNLIEHLNLSTNFVIRIKDPFSSGNGIAVGLDFPGDEFDVDYPLIFTNYNRVQYQRQKSVYKIIHKNQQFDFLDDNNHFYHTSWRIVRFMLEDGAYETVVTNLDRNLFNSDDIKELYRLRWSVETSFRYLKHDLNLTHFLSRKKEFLHQEIWAKMIMFNLCSMITLELEEKRLNKIKKKHLHKINFSNAVHLLVDAFRYFKRKDGFPPDLDAQITQCTSPVRNGRKFKRVPRPKNFQSSNYRIY